MQTLYVYDNYLNGNGDLNPVGAAMRGLVIPVPSEEIALALKEALPAVFPKSQPPISAHFDERINQHVVVVDCGSAQAGPVLNTMAKAELPNGIRLEEARTGENAGIDIYTYDRYVAEKMASQDKEDAKPEYRQQPTTVLGADGKVVCATGPEQYTTSSGAQVTDKRRIIVDGLIGANDRVLKPSKDWKLGK